MLLKNFPARYIAFAGFFTAWRFLVQIFSLIAGQGSAAQFSRSCGPAAMALAVLRAYGSAAIGAPKALRKRRAIKKGKMPISVEYGYLLKKFRISARELILKD